MRYPTTISLGQNHRPALRETRAMQALSYPKLNSNRRVLERSPCERAICVEEVYMYVTMVRVK